MSSERIRRLFQTLGTRLTLWNLLISVLGTVTAFAVAYLIEREQHLGAELARFFEHLVDHVAGVVGHGRQLFEDAFSAQHFVHHELHVAQGGSVLSHDETPLSIPVKHHK